MHYQIETMAGGKYGVFYCDRYSSAKEPISVHDYLPDAWNALRHYEQADKRQRGYSKDKRTADRQFAADYINTSNKR